MRSSTEVALLRLKHGAQTLDIAPAIGGSLAGLWHGDRPILRPATAQALEGADPLGMAEFPMAPWVGRIGRRRFGYNGRQFELERNFAPTDHAIHGLAWKRPWHVEACGQQRAAWSIELPAGTGGWPFACTVRRTATLDEHGARLTITLINDEADTAPFAIGLHPYFPSLETVLTMQSGAIWRTDNRGNAIGTTPSYANMRLAQGAVVNALDLDAAFVDWDGAATITSPQGSIRMSSSASLDGAPIACTAMVYTPRGEPYFCVEPMSAAPDSLNLAMGSEGAATLVPAGSTLSLNVTIR
jgi:aldose 1-epimerase